MWPGHAFSAPTSPMFTICPPRRLITRAAACAQKKAPRRLRSRWRSYCAAVAWRNGERSKTAALLTRTSSPPRRRAASRTSPRAAPGSARSARRARARAPAAWSSRTVRRAARAEPGLGFLTAIAIILLLGTIARNVVGRRVLAWGDKLLLRVPIYRRLYPSVKLLIDSFSPERRSAFRAVVLVEHPRVGEYAFGFVTSQLLLETPDGKRDMVTVFVPTNNLYLGDVVVVPQDDVIATGLTVEEGIRIVLSAGNATPARLPRG